ncbi:MAG: extracellular solute-binding protein [Snowella sp.]|nr:extracellular solute-binding protein [Snowella sp.]
MFILNKIIFEGLNTIKQRLKIIQIFPKKVWKFVYLGLLIFSFLGIVSCTNLSSFSPSTQLQGNLFIWHSLENEISQLLDKVCQEFQKLNPDVTIQSIYIPKEQIIPHFIEQSQKGFGASVLIDATQSLPELIQAKRLQVINETDLDEKIYYPHNLNQVRYQGKIYGIPLGSHTKVLCYNQAKLNTTNDPILRSPPTTLDELTKRAIKGYSVGLVSSFEDTFWGISNFGGSLLDSQGNLKPQLAAWSQWLTWLKKAGTQQNFILLRGDSSVLNKAFIEEKLTYYVCNATEIAGFKNVLKDNFKIALLPNKNPFHAAPLLYTKAFMINRSASDNEKQLALALGRFLSNPEHQLQGVVKTQSFIPTNRHVVLDKTLLPIESILLQQAQTAISFSLEVVAKLLPTFEPAEQIYQSAIAGDISTEEAAQQLTTLIEQSHSER